MDATFMATALFMVSAFTSLTVEGIKKLLSDKNINYSSNILAAVLSVIIALAVAAGYVVMNDVSLTAKFGVETLALMYLSFLVSTVGYDKVIQAFSQLKKK